MSDSFYSIQVSPISFVDEGVETVLDFLKNEARLNALLVTSHSFTFGTLGRSKEGFIPDHGKQEASQFEGGSLVQNDARYYEGLNIKEFAIQDEELKGIDSLKMSLDEAHERGFRVYSRFAENSFETSLPRVIPGFARVLAIDVLGRRVNSPCFNHPDYRNWYLAAVEDHVKSYDIEGIAFGAEGAGPLHHLFKSVSVPRCFCSYCQEQAHLKGINIESAREGWTRLWKFVRDTEERPPEGYFISLLRILMNWPEILAWEKLYLEARQSLRKEIYGVIKAIDAEKEVGWHLWHTITYDPIFRAEVDYSEYPDYSDWLKPAIYHACTATRMHEGLLNTHQRHLWRDLSHQQLTDLYYAILGFDEMPYDQMMKSRFGYDYMYNETARIVAATDNRIPVYPGIDIDIPASAPELRSEPDDIREALKAIFDAGAKGFVLSRKYSEMRKDNLRAVGEYIKSL